MTREKVDRRGEYLEVIYDDKRWEILHLKREKAKPILIELARRGIQGFVHGSTARGDVTSKSDIDIIITEYRPSYIIEVIIEKSGYKIYSKQIVQATPFHTPKLYYILDPNEEVVVSFPLAKLLPREIEFYKWGGILSLQGLARNLRVPGVNKRLHLVLPTPSGHRETPVIGRENEVASILGISVDTVNERVRVLTRRDEIGRTGVFLKIDVGMDETPESVLRRIADRNPMLRKVLLERGF